MPKIYQRWKPLAPTLKALKYDMINCVIRLKNNTNVFLAHVDI